MKKKIYFIAPKNKGGTYFYYKDISKYLIENNLDLYDVKFCNTFFDYIKLHFIKADVVFSIIPFFFKPILAKKYIFNLHGNYKIERKNKGLGVKLLYLSELNLWFSDKIMLTSFYLSDKLNFRKKYESKIEIIPNFIKEIDEKNTQLSKNEFNFLTITGFNFYDKGKGIINLGNVIKKLGEIYSDKTINFNIVGNENNEIFLKIKQDFDKIIFTNNVKINFKGWLNKEQIKNELLNNNTFLYWSYLDTYAGVVIDAINFNLKSYINNFECFNYIYDKNIICKNEDEMVEKIFKDNYKNETIIYSLKDVVSKIITVIK